MYICGVYTVLGLLAAATIFNVLGMVGLSVTCHLLAYNKCKTIQTPVGQGCVMMEKARKISV